MDFERESDSITDNVEKWNYGSSSNIGRNVDHACIGPSDLKTNSLQMDRAFEPLYIYRTYVPPFTASS
jgi:hypothetical protein